MGMQHPKVPTNLISKFYVMRGVFEGQIDMWNRSQYAAEEEHSSYSPTWFVLFCESCPKHSPLGPPSCCPCPCTFTSPQNCRQEEKTFKKEITSKAKTLMAAPHSLRTSYPCLPIHKGIDKTSLIIQNKIYKVE